MDTAVQPTDLSSISGPMTTALVGYAAVFMRYALAVTPKNYLLFGCHFVNFNAQSVQMYRYLNLHYGSGVGVDKTPGQLAKDAVMGTAKDAKKEVEKVAEKVSK